MRKYTETIDMFRLITSFPGPVLLYHPLPEEMKLGFELLVPASAYSKHSLGQGEVGVTLYSQA